MNKRRVAIIASGLGAFLAGCSAILGIDDGVYDPLVEAGGGDVAETGTLDTGGDVVTADAATDVESPDGEAGLGEVIASGLFEPKLLTQDSTHLYWVAFDAIYSMPKSGGTPKQLAMVPGASSLATEPGPTGELFVTAGTTVEKVPRDGGAAVALYSAGVNTASVRVDDSFVFFLDDTGPNGETRVQRTLKDGGSRVALSDQLRYATLLGVHSSGVAWLSEDADQTSAAIHEVANDGTLATVKKYTMSVATAYIAGDRALTLDQNKIYWIDYGNTTTALRAQPRDGGPAPSLATIGNDDDPIDIAIDGDHVYALSMHFENGKGTLIRVSKGGGASVNLAQGLLTPTSMVVDASYVYVTEQGGTIKKFPLQK